ncbi:hypothetical protein [Nostoc commune]|nr:hypothetical protein [Nostoc commune]
MFESKCDRTSFLNAMQVELLHCLLAARKFTESGKLDALLYCE